MDSITEFVITPVHEESLFPLKTGIEEAVFKLTWHVLNIMQYYFNFIYLFIPLNLFLKMSLQYLL